MIDSYLRRFYQPVLVDPLLSPLASVKCSPHLFTFGAFASGLAIIPAMIYQKPWIAFVLLLVSGFLDTVDDKDTAKKLIDDGIQGIITNHPKKFLHEGQASDYPTSFFLDSEL